jgi:hypothetical protein
MNGNCPTREVDMRILPKQPVPRESPDGQQNRPAFGYRSSAARGAPDFEVDGSSVHGVFDSRRADCWQPRLVISFWLLGPLTDSRLVADQVARGGLQSPRQISCIAPDRLRSQDTRSNPSASKFRFWIHPSTLPHTMNRISVRSSIRRPPKSPMRRNPHLELDSTRQYPVKGWQVEPAKSMARQLSRFL